MSRPDPHPLLRDYSVHLTLPVQWGEMDAYGHVNNTVFFRYFESTRMAYLEACGLTASMARDQVGAILHSTSCRFRRPLVWPDEVHLGGRVVSLETDRFLMEYRIVSSAQQAVAAEGTGLIVCFDYQAGAKVPVPGTVAERIRLMDGSRLAPRERS